MTRGSTSVANLIDDWSHLPGDVKRLTLAFTRPKNRTLMKLKPRLVRYKDHWYYAAIHPILKTFTNLFRLSQLAFEDGLKRALYEYSQRWDCLIDTFESDLVEEELDIVEQQARQIKAWYESL